jgi:hypothetical protein
MVSLRETDPGKLMVHSAERFAKAARLHVENRSKDDYEKFKYHFMEYDSAKRSLVEAMLVFDGRNGRL